MSIDSGESGTHMEEDSLYFNNFSSNGCKRLTDFVLVWEEKPDSKSYAENAAKRQTYLTELRKAGLEMEEGENIEANSIHFVKLHVPRDILKKFAEILNMRMALKKSIHTDLKDFKKVGSEGRMDYLVMEEQQEIDSGKVKNTKLNLEKEVQRGTGLDSNDSYTAIYSRDKDYLFDSDDPDFFYSDRSRIVQFILRRERFLPPGEDDFAFGISKLISDGVYLAAYPLHDGTIESEGSQRQFLYKEWASLSNWWKFQPLDAIKDYFGVKIGLYFAWLGLYTMMLIPASLMGIICFLYGWVTDSSDISTVEICLGNMTNTTMCPICDESCGLWKLQEACTITKVKHLFDNNFTVIFAVFMSLWAVLFLETWKRYSAEICHRWDVYGFDPEEEHPRPEYFVQLQNVEPRDWRKNYVTHEKEPVPSFWKMKIPGILVSWSSVAILIVLAAMTVFAIIVYRMSMVVALAAVRESAIKKNYSIFITITSASINLIVIMIFNYIYGHMAAWLTEREFPRTQTSYDSSLTVKIYIFQFVNCYAPLFYVAFIKGQFIGTPDEYRRLFGYRQEECAPGGCFMELAIHLAIIFMGKQFLASIPEYYLPLVVNLINRLKRARWKKKKGNLNGTTPQYIKDFLLNEWKANDLFHEYLEMVIQYGFISIFVSAFSLAPLFALINNVLEVRLDAKKILVEYRRPAAQTAHGIGVWFDIMETLGKISVLTNALIISLTSEFIPKLIYTYFYSEDSSLVGYVNFSLSTFALTDMDPKSRFNVMDNYTVTNGLSDQYCRYPDYNNGPEEPNKYQPNAKFFHILGARLLFVVIFENLIGCACMALKLLIPDVSSSLKNKIGKEDFITTKLIMEREEAEKKNLLAAMKSLGNM